MSRRIILPLVLVLVWTLPLAAQSGASEQAMPPGWEAIRAGDADRAASLFHDGLARSPRDPILHFGAGVAAHMLGRDREASQSLRRALELEPRLTDASRVLGEIEYHAGDVDAAIRTFEQALVHAPGDREIRQRLEVWRKEAAVHRSLVQRNDGRFSIVFEGRTDKALADRAIATLDAAYWRIGKAIGAYPADTIVVTLYTEQQFRDITRAPDWSDGLYDGRIRVPVKGALQNLQRFDRVLVHELSHAMVSTLAPRGVPAWLHEGLASYFEPQDPARAMRSLQSARLIPLTALTESFSSLTEREATVAYLESLVVADILMQRVGARMAIVLQALDRGQSLGHSLQLLGITLEDLQRDLLQRAR
jgi:tetratricopeptide (TPR) repeat protein